MTQGLSLAAKAEDGSALPIYHFAWGSLQVVTAPDDNTSARVATALTAGPLVFVKPRGQVHVRMGDSSVEAGTSDPILDEGAVYVFPRAAGETHIAFERPASFDTAADVEVWEADLFTPAADYTNARYSPYVSS